MGCLIVIKTVFKPRGIHHAFLKGVWWASLPLSGLQIPLPFFQYKAGELLIRTSFCELCLYGICHCVSNQNQPHDVVGPNTCLKIWAECRKGEDGMTVNQELDLDGKIGEI